MPPPAVVVLSGLCEPGAESRTVTELQQSCLGHQIGDLGGIQLGRVNGRCLQFLDGNQLLVGINLGRDGVLE
ncbi:hypothetical protein D3C73_1585140 [compost metagenome]